MGRLEKIFLGVLCLACLALPLGTLLTGALDLEEPDLGGGRVVYKRSTESLQVKTWRAPGALPVMTTNSGRAVREGSANDIPTTTVEDRLHTPADEIPVRQRRTRGLQPEVPAEQ